ncbi:MAG: phage portal protein [Oscillospiraceae bacterium]|nr:phage portal protein [Oscillospiraceae bacterium]
MAKATGLTPEESALVVELVNIFNHHYGANRMKRKYYEGHITLGEVNLGLALPNSIMGLEIGCSWGEKAVDVLAARSMFDGFVGRDGNDAELMTELMNANRLRAEYMKACRDELKYGCTFATLSKDPVYGCRIRWHSPETASAKWDGEKQKISAGLVIVDQKKDNDDLKWKPSVLHLHTDYAVIELRRDKYDRWSSVRYPHSLGRPMMEPLIWNATSAKPFGRSRLKEPVRRLIQGYVRTVANATIGLEFSTSPQKYILGITDDQYDAVVDQKFRTYVGSLLAATTNPETGEKPTFGQLSQGTIEPHVAMMRVLSTQFSAATGLTVTDVGVINDANPTSSDAILAQSQTLVLLAEQLNTGNGDALYMISQMAQAIAKGVRMDDLEDEEKDISAHFKNPAMPSVSVTADAAVKIATTRPTFGSTDVYLEMLGFDQADIRRIKAQESRARGLQMLTDFEVQAEEAENGNIEEGLEAVY